MENEVKTKVCKKCGQELPLDQFHMNDNCKDGHLNVCKKCKNSHDKLRNQIKKESQSGIHKVFVNPDLYVWLMDWISKLYLMKRKKRNISNCHIIMNMLGNFYFNVYIKF